MKNNIKIYTSLNEFKESEEYAVQKWFSAKKLTFKTWFENELFKDLKFDYYDFSQDATNSVYVGSLRFHEDTISYNMEIVFDEKDIQDNVINNITINLKGYDVKTTEIAGELSRDTTDELLTQEFLLDLITEFKTKNDDNVKKQTGKKTEPIEHNNTKLTLK